MAPIGAVGFELWTMQDNIEFDNVFIDNNIQAAEQFAEASWGKKYDQEKTIHPEDSDEADNLFIRLGQWIGDNIPLFVALVVGIVTLLVVGCLWCNKADEPHHPQARQPSPHTTSTTPPVTDKEKKDSTEGEEESEPEEEEPSQPKKEETSKPKKEEASKPKKEEASKPKKEEGSKPKKEEGSKPKASPKEASKHKAS